MSFFTEKVYQVVKGIPVGQILTYQQIAKKIKEPQSARAVALVLSKNYDSNIPCHRVIRSDGKIGGYNRGAKKKIELLKKEGINIKNGVLNV